VTITTTHGSGRGVIRFVRDDESWSIWTLFTTLERIAGHEDLVGSRRTHGVQHGAKPDRKNWLDRRVEEANFQQGKPQVLIVG
jgi:hypothetical protein